MVLTATVLPLSLTWVNDARDNRQQVEDRLTVLRHVHELLIDAETGQRGYVITGKDAFLQPYHAALSVLPAEFQTLSQRYVHNSPAERQLVNELLQNAKLRIQGLAKVVEVRQNGGFAAAEAVVTSGQGKHYMDEVRRISAELGTIEARELAERDGELRSKNWVATAFSVVSTLLSLGLLGYLAAMMARTIRRGEQSAAQAHRTSEELEHGMTTLRRRNDEMSILGEMSRLLQTEMTPVEALEVTSLFCSRLLPGTVGTIYLYRNSEDLLELAGTWGSVTAAPAMEPQACWGLRRGQVHRHGGASDLRCTHAAQATPPDSPGHFELCLPLTAYGEVLGLLNVQGGPAAMPMDEAAAMAQTISEQVALTLSNAKLRQVLRDQSIKDPLTGLFNRRYMEETLTRELARAQRNGTSVGIVVADLDHFKKINDTHGHPAGDAVLLAAARHMAQMIRASDVACRYGGEEFVLILPDCTRDAAMLKAQQICDSLRALQISAAGASISVTASFGVSASPSDGDTAALLFQAADHAVYDAKRGGRNRVAAATATPGQFIPH
ncbi:MAG: diguanylate cyclase [Rubrivivax sp.]|nr:MAG: diguanylate cyclase [Rubrivivax sp.]